MNTVDRLKDVFGDATVSSLSDAMYFNIKNYRDAPAVAAARFADLICSKYGLSADVLPQGIVFYFLSSRGKHPACAVVSMFMGQPASPSAVFVKQTTHALIQVFEGDADDTDVAGDCPKPTHRVQAKGRLLLC